MRHQKPLTKTIARIALLVLLIVLSAAFTGFGQDPSGRPTDPGKSGKKPPTRKPPVRVEPQPVLVTLTILSDPVDAEVLLNGESRGTTGQEGKLQIEKLQLGRYSVEVRKDGYQTMLRGFDAGTQTPTLVFKLEPKFEDYQKQFDSIFSSGKLTGPETPNAIDFVRDLSKRFPDRPEVVRMRGVLAAKFTEGVAPVINRTAMNWRDGKREEIARALENASYGLEMKPDDARIQSEIAYLKGALALYDWQRGKPEGEGEGGLSTARAEFENALKSQEAFAAARYQLGVVLLASKDAAGAEASFVRAIQLEPRWAFAQTMLGMTYQVQGRYKDAVDTFKKALELDPNQSAAVAGLGLARFSKGEKDGVKDVERAMKLDPAAALPHLYLGMIYSQSRNKKELARAEEEFTRAIQMNPQNLEFQNSAAERMLADLKNRKK